MENVRNYKLDKLLHEIPPKEWSRSVALCRSTEYLTQQIRSRKNI